ncbi:hypothetical protein M409DRAFT_24376 [Zasmidium cellare ATCC 36951]|uniref:Uncharacterized protein n=1 Tax=Zasmidium cellare ATCC 36951 TaxID=1080233 RepID=A0A6A6CFV2_ZASCE|nr:uncharacterized protein M409DRAFT_24376 [Zasmidium cellare ATCC 36951]KAF2165523.1 hypothetical protein M409DRAFT_24376 [Zasmidium cellare ATCC 36951]
MSHCHWPGTRGRPPTTRGAYQGPDDPTWTGRDRFNTSRMWNRNLRRYAGNDRGLEVAYGGGWGGAYGREWFDEARGRLRGLQGGGGSPSIPINTSTHYQTHTSTMQGWPGSRGRPSFGRAGYFGPNGRFRGRDALLDNQLVNRTSALGWPQYDFGYGGGWAGPWGQTQRVRMQNQFNALQPGFVYPGRRSYGNAPRYGGFI